MLMTRHRDADAAARLRARDREMSAANHWAAVQPLSERKRTMEVLDAWAARLNDACTTGALVLRIGLTLQAPRGLARR